MPEAVATARSPCSSAARRSSNALTVGLVYREYTLPVVSPENLAAASSAVSNRKLEDVKIGSACSASAVRRIPARTARVRGPASSSH